MDNSIGKDIQFLPESVLAQAVHSPNGQIPSWMALAELNKRNQIRATATQNVPQGTVADEVLGTLRQSGMSVLPQPQTMAPGASNAQQMPSQQQPQSFAQGGIIHMADGGQTPSSDPMDLIGGIMGAPQLKQLNPADYQVQYQAPQYVDPSAVEQKVKDRFGPGVDYSPMLQELDQMKASLHPFSRRDALRDIGFSLMSSKEQNPLVSFGQAAQGALANERSVKDQNFKMSHQLMSDRMKILQDQQSQQDKIASAIDQNEQLMNQRALTESTQKNTFNERNNTVAKDIAEKNNDILVKRFALGKQVRDELKDPIAVAQALDQAHKALNDPEVQKDPAKLSKATAAVDLLTNAGSDIWNTKQKTSDIEKNRELDISKNSFEQQKALSGINFGHQVSLEKMREGHAEQMQKLQQNGGNDSPDAIEANKNQALIDFQKQFAFGIKPTIPRGKEANGYLSLMRQQGDKWMKDSGLSWQDSGTQIAQYKANADALRHVQDASAMTEGSESAMSKQVPIITDIAQQIKRSGVPVIDKHWIETKSKSGDINAKLLENWMNTFSFEYARLNAGSGQSTNALREDGKEMFTTGLNNGQLQAVLNGALKEGQTRKAGYSDVSKNLSNNIRNLGSPNQSNSQPDQAPSSGSLTVKAPNGKTYSFGSQADADRFRKAAGIQ